VLGRSPDRGESAIAHGNAVGKQAIYVMHPAGVQENKQAFEIKGF